MVENRRKEEDAAKARHAAEEKNRRILEAEHKRDLAVLAPYTEKVSLSSLARPSQNCQDSDECSALLILERAYLVDAYHSEISRCVL